MEGNKKIESFEDLIVWQKADLMFDMVCDGIKNFPNNRVAWVINDQLLRCVGSISANIAEGFGAGYRKEFLHSLRIARKENSEAMNWLIKVKKQEWITEKRFLEYQSLSTEIRKIINTIINRLNNKF